MHRLFSLQSTKCMGFSSSIPFMEYLWALFSFSQLAWEWEFPNWSESSVATTPVVNPDIIHLFHTVCTLMPPRTMLISLATQSLRACIEVLIWCDAVSPSRTCHLAYSSQIWLLHGCMETSNAGLRTKNHQCYFTFPFRSLIKALSDTGLTTSLGKLVLTPFWGFPFY